MALHYVRSTDGVDTDNGSTWALAEATVAGAIAQPSVAGDRIWVSDAHSFVATAAITWTLPATPGLQIICGDDAAEPPTAFATTGKETTNGNFTFTIGGFGLIKGMIIEAGSGAAGASAFITLANNSTPNGLVFENCAFVVNTTSAGGLYFGNIGGASLDNILVKLKSCSIKFGAAAQCVNFRTGRWHLQNFSIDDAGVAPTTLFAFVASASCDALVEASNLSGEAWTYLVNVASAVHSKLIVRDCQFPASFTITTGTHPGIGGPFVGVYNCHSGDTHCYFYECSDGGTCANETAIYKDAGSTIDSVNVSAKLVSRAGVVFDFPLYGMAHALKIDTGLGASKTLTFQLVFDSAADKTNAQIWVEALVFSTAGVPLATVVSSRVADQITDGTNLTASSETWTGTGGFANAKKRQIALAFTPQEIGYVEWRVCVADPSLTVYYDLEPALT